MQYTGDEREMAKKGQEVNLTGNPHYANQNIETPSFTYQIGMDSFKVIPSIWEGPYPLERVLISQTF